MIFQHFLQQKPRPEQDVAYRDQSALNCEVYS